jgi:hypothetical protein
MDQGLGDLHKRALAVAKRILSGTQTERYELGVAEPADNSRLFNDLVALAEQLLRDEELKQTCRTAA